jgi:hypothetical protein
VNGGTFAALRWAAPILLAAAGSFATSAASAGPVVPDAQFNLFAQASSTVFTSTSPGTLNAVGCSVVVCTSAHASVNSAPDPVLSVSGGDSGFSSSKADSVEQYYFSPVGPANILVPVLVSISGSVEAAFAGNSEAFVSEGNPIVAVKSFEACSGPVFNGIDQPSCGGITSFNVHDTWLVAANGGPYSLFLDAQGFVDTADFGFGEGSFSAILDPFLEIDPAFLATHPGYSLELSPNLTGGTTSVPEVSSWTTLLLGLAGLGLARSRRKAGATLGTPEIR